MLGFEKISHQPVWLISVAPNRDVRKRPSVGTSQRIPTKTRTRWTGAFPTMRRMRAATLSLGAGRRASAAAVATRSDLPPEAADVEGQDWDDEEEEEDRNRRTEPEVADAAERGPPHGKRDHV